MNANDGSAPALAIRSITPGRVVGSIAARGPRSVLSLATVVDLTSTLAFTGASAELPEGKRLLEVDCQARLFGRMPVGEIAGDAIAFHQDGQSATWQVILRAASGEVLAATTLHYVLVEEQPAEGGTETTAREPDAAALAANGDDREQMPTLADKRREQIAAAASDVIARKGFANATVREIAEAAGLHVPTMYQYIGSKDELLELVYNWTMASVRTDVAEATAGCTTAIDKLTTTIASLIEKGDQFRHRIGVLNRELRSLSPPARARVLTHYRKLLQQIADLVTEGMDAGELRRVEPQIAANLIDAIADIWPLRQFALGEFGRERFQAEVTDFIIAGLRSELPQRGKGRQPSE